MESEVLSDPDMEPQDGQAQNGEGLPQESFELCDQEIYTAQVNNISCTSSHLSFESSGLPDPSATLMTGITATNQQYPRPHNLELSFPLIPNKINDPVFPDPGAIGVAVDGVPLFSPWTQGEILSHTAEVGELDVCGGHAGRGDDYHYHVAPSCLIELLGEKHVEERGWPIGIANDGNPIRALGWFDESNRVEEMLDSCRGMTDASGSYFYNVEISGLQDILNCFTYEVHKTSKDSFEGRVDFSGSKIVGAKLPMEITGADSTELGLTTVYSMIGELTEAKLIGSNGSVNLYSGPAAIFYANKDCYGEYFEPDSGFPGGSVFFEVVSSGCPSGLDLESLVLTDPYEGPILEKRSAKD